MGEVREAGAVGVATVPRAVDGVEADEEEERLRGVARDEVGGVAAHAVGEIFVGGARGAPEGGFA